MKEIEQEAEKISKAFKDVVKNLKWLQKFHVTDNDVKSTYIR